jgi:hypothetical protein
MTMRKFLTALLIATIGAAIFGAQIEVFAVTDKAVLLSGIQADENVVSGLMFQSGHQMGYLAPDGRAITNDVAHALELLGQLQRKTFNDSTAVTLAADQARFTYLHGAMTSLEGPKVGLASLANAGRAEYNDHLTFERMLGAAGGMDPNSPIHPQAVAFLQAMSAAKTALDRAVGLLDQATLASYPQSLALLPRAKSAIDLGTAKLQLVDQLAAQNVSLVAVVHERTQIRQEVSWSLRDLITLRGVVVGSPFLNTAERANLLTQIDADMVALRQLDRWSITAANGAAPGGELAKLNSEPGVFLLIRPKADIMLAGAADRSAVQKLMALLPYLGNRIARAAAAHQDVTVPTALLHDISVQLTAVAGDIAPIDAEFESMTAMTSGQIGHDYHVIKMAEAALTDANTRLAAARNDTAQIIAAT